MSSSSDGLHGVGDGCKADLVTILYNRSEQTLVGIDGNIDINVVISSNVGLAPFGVDLRDGSESNSGSLNDKVIDGEFEFAL